MVPNPATAAMIGFDVVEIKSNARGLVDIDALKGVLGPRHRRNYVD